MAQVRLGNQGRLVIPADLRAQLGLAAGDVLTVRVEDQHLVLERPEAALARLKALFAHIPPGVSLADEIIAERREEARRENAE